MFFWCGKACLVRSLKFAWSSDPYGFPYRFVILAVSKKTAISNFHRKLSTFSLHTRNTAITLVKLYLEGNPVSVK
jgi:hypothetical protein